MFTLVVHEFHTRRYHVHELLGWVITNLFPCAPIGRGVVGKIDLRGVVGKIDLRDPTNGTVLLHG